MNPYWPIDEGVFAPPAAEEQPTATMTGKKRKSPLQTPRVTPFVAKLKAWCDDAEHSAVSWSMDGTTIAIGSIEAVEREIGAFFRTRRCKSFVRQLNFYGFRKTAGNRVAGWEFSHPLFIREGCALSSIRRETGVTAEVDRLDLEVRQLKLQNEKLAAEFKWMAQRVTDWTGVDHGAVI